MTTPIVIVEPPADPPVLHISPPGLPGPVGPAGPTGPMGGAPTPVTVTLTAASSYHFTHTFGFAPGVQVVDDTGALVYMGVTYTSSTDVLLVFPTPFTGKAIFR